MSLREIFFLIGVLLIAVAVVVLAPVKNRIPLSDGGEVKWARVADSKDTKLTISWAGSPAFPTAREGTWVEEMLEKRFNIELKPHFDDYNAYANRRPLMYSGGDVPDVNWDGDPTQVRRNVHQGFVLEVPYEVILRHAPNYVKNLNQYGREAWLYSQVEGRNYGIPTFAANGNYPFVPFWRADWLHNVGIEKTPETLSEMHTALWKFRHEDPDRNGVKDTYGMCPSTFWPAMFQEVFAAYNILPQDFMWRDGEMVWGGIQPEAKQALKLLRDWYAEELIDPDFASATSLNPVMDRKLQNGKIGYAFAWGTYRDMDLNVPSSTYATLKELNPVAVLAAGKPLFGIDGNRRSRVWGGAGHVIWFGKQVAQKPEKVLRVLEMLEELAVDRDLYIKSRMGERGKHWEWSPERGIYLLPPYNERGAGERNLLKATLFEGCFGFYSPCAFPGPLVNDLLPTGEISFREEFAKPSWGVMNALGKSDTVPSSGKYLEDLRLFQTTTYIQIITGKKPLEYFDDFVVQWKARGGDILTAEAKMMKARMEEIFLRVDANPMDRFE